MTAVHISKAAGKGSETRGIRLFGRIVIRDPFGSYQEERIGALRIIDAGHRQGGLIGRGRAHNAVIRVGGIGQVVAGGAIIRGTVIVACGAEQVDASLLHPLIDGIHRLGRGGGKAGSTAEAHVDGIRAQLHRVIQGSQDIIIISARAFVIKDLHDKELGIRSNTGNGVAGVGPHDAGDMRSVIVTGDVGIAAPIIKGKGDLAGVIDRLGTELTDGQAVVLDQVIDITLIILRVVDLALECLMVDLQPGIQNGHHGSFAGVAVGVHDIAADHGDAVRQLDLSVQRLHQRMELRHEGVLDAVGILDRLQVAVSRRHGEAVEHGAVLAVHLQIHSAALQCADNTAPLGAEGSLLPLRLGRAQVVADAAIGLNGLAAGQQRGSFQLNDNAYLVVGPESLGVDLFLLEDGIGILLPTPVHGKGGNAKLHRKGGRQQDGPESAQRFQCHSADLMLSF